MTYNLTNATNATNVMELAQATNEILGGYYFGYFVLLIIFCVTFLALKSKGYLASASFAVACWLVSLSALFLRPLGLLDNFVFWVALLMTPIAVFGLFLSSNLD